MRQHSASRWTCLALLLATGITHAAGRAQGFGVAFECDLEYGGDDIATVEFTDGSGQHVKTAQGVTAAIGGQYRASADSPFSVRGTVGYKYVTTAASNADIHIGRVVYELVGGYVWDSGWRLGAGITHHSNIKFDADGFGQDVRFDDATGPTVELGWRWIALSYTQLDYTDEYGGNWDASSFGLTLISKF